MLGSKRLEEDLPMSSNEFAIKISNLSKCYEVYSSPADRLKQFIYPSIKRLLGRKIANHYREFWALRRVSFDVRRGEAVGIVGRNGAGKSTLLQLIAGTLAPTTGEIEVNGRVAALLELGSGFNPEFTGRENVYLNASILGLSEEEVDQRFEEIAAFADIGDFIDQPLSTYSSGMMMRLAFAVNTCVSPDILIVDEALGVGDAPFQAKCFKRLRELAANGTSLLFVSHDIEIVRSLCSRALWLKNGIPENWGDAKEVTKGYEKYCWIEQGVAVGEQDSQSKLPKPAELQNSENNSTYEQIAGLGARWHENLRTKSFLSRNGNGALRFVGLRALTCQGVELATCGYNEEVTLSASLFCERDIASDFVISFGIFNPKGECIYQVTDTKCINRLDLRSGSKVVINIVINTPFKSDNYYINGNIFGFIDGSAYSAGLYDFNRAIIWDSIEGMLFFHVKQCDLMPLPGPVHVHSDIKFFKISE